MKKNLLFVAVAATALVGCSSDETLSNETTGSIVESDLVPVELSLSRNSVNVFQTRGTGTVGDTEAEAAKNVYQNEDFFVLMTTVPTEEKPDWEFTYVGKKSDTNNALGVQFDGSFKSRPVDGADTDEDGNLDEWGIDYLTYTDQKKKYYPTDGSLSDFFAFYVDDAAVSTQPSADATYNVPVIEDAGDSESKYVEFKIDGTQDLLAGKAMLDAEELAAKGITGITRGFSAKTARKDIIPSIPMKHLLTRLTFGVTPGHQGAEGLVIKSIKVQSRSEGKMTVAYNDNGVLPAAELIEWTQAESDMSALTEETDTFTLHAIPVGDRIDADGNKTNLEVPEKLLTVTKGLVGDEGDFQIVDNGEEASPRYTFNGKRVGDAIFVQPNQTKYTMKIAYEFPYGVDDDSNVLYHSVEDEFPVQLSDGTPLGIGKSYHINITVYGLSEIRINTTLEAWLDGGTIEIDTAEPAGE